MKFKVLILLTILGLISFSAEAQRGVRIGYIDTEYILQNVPEYSEASSQLDKKVQQWKTEIETKLNAIEQKKKELENERVLLTKELYDERYEDISFEEAEILDYQQKRFGPEGDLMIQKRQLIEPIQDQIFAAVQEIAETKKYDFVFDKSADVVMLYSAERYDVSEQVLRTITRTSKRTQAKNKQERKELEEEEVVPEVRGDRDERQQALEDRKAQREAQLEARRAEREKAAEERRKAQQELRDAKIKEAEERRQNAIEARNKGTESNEEKKIETETVKTDSTNARPATVKKDSLKVENTVKKDSTSSAKPKTAAEIAREERLQKLKDREARQKALEDRKKKIIEQRKKAREEREKQIEKLDSIAKAKKEKEGNNN
ncbi:periplasmic chaperone for outer membrane proteins Skp [Winogradskyella epiphytica]|uniref:Periplasmic chaperone for outer membrane proteins Skp n=1 Tax=Winogradskyella epiphytica TaxID=262005 RepID=A0A2V4XDH3_9FLAO|nr:OmpH family outer membrane protein [Winogradskyella epiphytica]PYE80645.1 periplasmic chaperone for outer membrane proteins Skp [Winogradskyella epiphytica]GGW67417.1 membrane protein [Winogradskyella epiphytica]